MIRFVLLIWVSVWAWSQEQNQTPTVDETSISQAEKLLDLQFDRSERELMRNSVDENRLAYEQLHKQSVNNAEIPAFLFNPGYLAQVPLPTGSPQFPAVKPLKRPADLEEIVFWPLRDLAELIRTRQITCLELTQFYLERLKKYGPQLECVISLTEDRALAQARLADQQIQQGTYKGPLHGIPYGAKDLLAVRGYRTTWGAKPFSDQVLDQDAEVIRKLDDAGAILIGKLTLGALAWGDVWFGGQTRNPWNRAQGSSGSSAGSASATAAGLVPFAIGSETWGSIVSPATRCQVTGLRPSFGRVSRSGAMALSWTMDKLGPLTRDAWDAALVFEAIRGADPADPYSVGGGFPFHFKKPKSLRIGYIADHFQDADDQNLALERTALERFKAAGYQTVALHEPDLPTESLSFILSAEAAAAFDELTRSNQDAEMVRQVEQAWPNVFRASRLIPAVEYIQANRLRVRLVRAIEDWFAKVDVVICPSFAGNQLLATNLSGHPCVVVPLGIDEAKNGHSLSFISGLYREDTALAAAIWFQQNSQNHLAHPQDYP
ncbi:MAG: amidase [Acidobacteria bacterium]|nr:amidase [Acidobacteriota bacterium]MCB9398516.1 amidase [Acidobacteriota bacterium]